MTFPYSPVPVRAYQAPQINSGSACVIDYSSRDIDNTLEAPDALEYRIDNLTDSVVVQGWTSVPTPGTSGSVTLSADTNSMTYLWRDKQLNQITFKATYADGQVIQNMAYIQLCSVFQGVNA